MHLIEHIVEPQRLLLRWQAPTGREGDERTHWIVGELKRNNGEVTLQYRIGNEDLHKAKSLGFEGYPAFRKFDKTYTQDVLETFARRLPPRSRRDFAEYLEQYRISPEVQISDFALLGYTCAKLPSDGFSIINPFDEAWPPLEFVTEVAGFRYYAGMRMEMNLGEPVSFEAEPDNPADPSAIRVLCHGHHIGYVTRGHIASMHRWLTHCQVSACLERRNGPPERPQVYLFVSVT